MRWFTGDSSRHIATTIAHDTIPVADTGLINGVGRFNGGPAIPFAVVNVVQHRRYRLRIINESARAAYNFFIDSHNFTIIETDGVNTNPISGNQIPILAGQ
ncbi:hypothetical protein E1B28_000053 [Marasmius oreades]|uniref:Plastocyanin-like domain-containing protein n=1 Tax=Marasmius oreades TaxID=181124 RepID=A0A9P7V0I2_9AGAR|nr:uncharacterized protein E1B28_000053 [Marasmius oreades]KAG7098079.1 hypothetical protein E1B28_000053 [Marasmius oreades]